MDALKTVREAAKLLTLSPHTLRVWIQERRIESVRLGRVVRIPLAEIERLIEGGRTTALPLPTQRERSKRSLLTAQENMAEARLKLKQIREEAVTRGNGAR